MIDALLSLKEFALNTSMSGSSSKCWRCYQKRIKCSGRPLPCEHCAAKQLRCRPVPHHPEDSPGVVLRDESKIYSRALSNLYKVQDMISNEKGTLYSPRQGNRVQTGNALLRQSHDEDKRSRRRFYKVLNETSRLKHKRLSSEVELVDESVHNTGAVVEDARPELWDQYQSEPANLSRQSVLGDQEAAASFGKY